MSRSIEKIIRGKMANSENSKEKTFDSYVVEYEEVIDTIIEILNNELPIEYKTTNNLEKLDYLFEELTRSYDFKLVIIATNYVVTRMKKQNFCDEEGNRIENVYAYLR